MALSLALMLGLWGMGIRESERAVLGDPWRAESGKKFFATPAWWSRPNEVNAFLRPNPFGARNPLGLWRGARGYELALDDGGFAKSPDGRRWRLGPEQAEPGLRLKQVAPREGARSRWALDTDGKLRQLSTPEEGWQPVDSAGAEVKFKALWANAEGSRLWLQSEEGVLWYSPDAAASWTTLTLSVHALAVAAQAGSTAAIDTAGKVRISQDPGQDWQLVDLGAAYLDGDLLQSLAVSSHGTHLWLLGQAQDERRPLLIRSEDGGKTWQRSLLPGTQPLETLSPGGDEKELWALGFLGQIFYSEDAGRSWQARAAPLVMNPLGVIALDGQSWLLGDASTLLRSTGKSAKPDVPAWEWLASNGARWLGGPALVGGKAWLPAVGGHLLQAELREIPGRTEWIAQQLPSQSVLTGVAVSADQRILHVSAWEGGVLSSRDSGRSWQSGTGIDPAANLLALTSTGDGQNVWAVGEGGLIYASTDAGRSWQRRELPGKQGEQPVDFLRVFFVDAQRGWVAGGRGGLLRTRDGGRQWTWQRLGDENLALSAVGFDAVGRRGVAVGEAGQVWLSLDGGETWAPQGDRTGAGTDLLEVQLSPQGQRAVALGSQGMLLLSRNGGQDWERQDMETEQELHGLRFSADGRQVLVNGSDGGVWLSRDGGETWQQAAVYEPGLSNGLWLLMGVAVALVLAALVWAQLRRQVLLREDRGEDGFKALADQPVDRAELDRLGFGSIVKAMSAFMRHASTKPPVVIAITAPWGRGKSSMMRMLEGERRALGVSTVWFNAWHHQQEPVLMAPLLAALNQALPPWLSWRGLRFRNRLVWARFRLHPLQGLLPLLMWWGLQLALLLTVLAVLIGAGQEAFDAWADGLMKLCDLLFGSAVLAAALTLDWSGLVKATLGTVTQQPWETIPKGIGLVLLWLNLFWLFGYYLRAFPQRPSVLLASVGARFKLTQADQQTNFRQHFRDHFSTVCQAMAPRHLTLFIDDLDRCEPAKSCEMLEAVNFLSDAGACFIVLGIAPEVIEAQLGEAYGGLADRVASFEAVQAAERSQSPNPDMPSFGTDVEAGKALRGSWQRQRYARNYLRKLIQVRVAVPALDSERLRAFFGQEFEDGGAQAFAGDPRLVELIARLRQQRAQAARAEQRRRRRSIRGWGLRALLLGGALLWLLNSGESWKGVKQAEYRALVDAREVHLQKLEEKRSLLLAAHEAQPRGASVEERAQRDRERRQHERLRKDVDQLFELLAKQKYPAFDERAARIGLELDEALKPLRATATALPALQASDVGDSVYVGRKPPPWGQGSGVAGSGAAVQSGTPHLAIGLFLIAGLGLLGFATVRDRYEIKPAQEYLRAIEHWHGLLLLGDSWRAPREAKRFLNLSRYLTMRLNPQRYGIEREVQTVSGWRRLWAWLTPSPAVQEAEFPESHIVALTALHMNLATSLPQPEDKLAFLSDPWAFVTRELGRERPLLPRAQLEALKLELERVMQRLQAQQAGSSNSGEAPSVDPSCLRIGSRWATLFLAALGELGEMPDSGPGAPGQGAAPSAAMPA